ncbi:murein hydrolase activator EnvC family protein [Alistipes indistinctus]|uniref:murein hydrolase activator EnvC family protein n=1 Tax=Alistipes indistinctus TaxID=626932 RepID=UPI00266F76D1|nr:peptidoglycan DD-metalloendopeptidase family protein [Alistipes indistinctus]
MNRPRLLLILAALFCALNLAAQNQSLDALRDEIRRAEEEIRATNELLAKTKKDKQVTQNQLKLIQNRIRNRKQIIANLEKQTQVINGDIGTKNDTVHAMQNELTQLRKEYADMVYAAYKNYKLNNFLVFLFASKDFNDATRRISYMRRYNRMRQQKAEQIKSVADSLHVQIGELENRKAELTKVRDTRTQEVSSLGKDEKQYQSSLSEINTKSGKLSSEIRKKQSQINKLQQRIQAIIAEEARKNRATPKSAAQEEYIANLSGRFDQNKGLLPYPVRGGVIVDRYGVHPHATQKGLMVNNKGINIASGSGAEVRAVFEGDITQIVFVQGLNNTVIIRHGNYLTTYSNLASVNVKTGDKVTLNQVIGRLSNSDDSDDCVLHFEIWEETENLNPEQWLRR